MLRATDRNSSTGILQEHLHSRNSNTKYFAGYMLFLEEQLEARATICLFAYLINSRSWRLVLPQVGGRKRSSLNREFFG